MFSVIDRCTPTCISSIINFLGVEGPFLDEAGPSRFFWRNCHLAGFVGAFSQLLKCFSKLLAWLMALAQWGWGGGRGGGNFFFLKGSSKWCCLSAVSLEKNLTHFLHLCLVLSIGQSIGCLMRCISSSVVENMTWSWASVKVLLQPSVLA